jgi:P27 family predicted phage terminase small subunit
VYGRTYIEAVSAMNPPKTGLDAASRRLWRVVVADLEDRAVLREADASAILRYVLAEQIARLAWVRVAEREIVDGVSAWRTRGSHGGHVVDIDVQIARNATRDAASFAADLGLSPRARRALREESPEDELDRLLSEIGGK